MTVLHVEEGPEYCHNGVNNRHATVERQFWDLGSLKLAIRISKLDDGLIVRSGIPKGSNTVIPGLLDVVLQWGWILKVY